MCCMDLQWTSQEPDASSSFHVDSLGQEDLKSRSRIGLKVGIRLISPNSISSGRFGSALSNRLSG
jgi:hypothetical protein